jgi:hypothetical protein
MRIYAPNNTSSNIYFLSWSISTWWRGSFKICKYSNGKNKKSYLRINVTMGRRYVNVSCDEFMWACVWSDTFCRDPASNLIRSVVSLLLIWYVLSVVCISFYCHINQPFVTVRKTSHYTFLFLQRSMHCSVSAFCGGNVFLFSRKYLFA